MSKIKQAKVIAVDASTNSLAFAYFEFGKLETIGKIDFEGSNIYQKCIDATKKVKGLFSIPKFTNSSLIIEHTVFMNSPKTAADLALVQGAIIGAAGLAGVIEIGRVSPITWQNYLGNKKLTKEEQLQVRNANPGKSISWYKSYERDFRKRRTIKLLEIVYDKTIDDYDVADAAGIGHWAINNWEKAVGFDK
jgi:hypothetical protein